MLCAHCVLTVCPPCAQCVPAECTHDRTLRLPCACRMADCESPGLRVPCSPLSPLRSCFLLPHESLTESPASSAAHVPRPALPIRGFSNLLLLCPQTLNSSPFPALCALRSPGFRLVLPLLWGREWGLWVHLGTGTPKCLRGTLTLLLALSSAGAWQRSGPLPLPAGCGV